MATAVNTPDGGFAGVAPRPGLNGTLSYPDSSGAVHGFQVRVESITHALKVVFDESTGRNRRAMYPHRMSDAQFTLGLVLVGQPERQAFTEFLGGFAATLLNPGASTVPVMTVSVPVRNFSRRGIPQTGFEWGAKLGRTAFHPQVTFETSWNPVDGPSDPVASGVPSASAVGDPNVQYFYPFGTQLSGDQVPGGGPLPEWAQVLAGLARLLDPSSWGQ